MFSIPIILQTYHPTLPFKLGKCIGQGNQGLIYENLDNPSEIIKLSILIEDFGNVSFDDRFVAVSKTYQHIIDNPHPSIVKIHKFDQLYKGSEFIFEWEQHYLVYYSIQERLQELSENEQKAFKTICDTFNKEIKVDRSIEIIIKELKEWLDFDDAKILSFYNSLPGLEIDNRDFEPRNIMKDKDGNIKLIDLDLGKIKEKENVEQD